jgi:hypothetical protein
MNDGADTQTRGLWRVSRSVRARILAGYMLFSYLFTYAAMIAFAIFMREASANRNHDDPFIHAISWVMVPVVWTASIPVVVLSISTLRTIIKPNRTFDHERRSRPDRTRDHDTTE